MAAGCYFRQGTYSPADSPIPLKSVVQNSWNKPFLCDLPVFAPSRLQSDLSKCLSLGTEDGMLRGN